MLMTCSALNGYANNGNENGWASFNPTTDDDLDVIYNLGVQAPGVVQIPVCTADIAWANWVGGFSTEENFPCHSFSDSKVRRPLVAPRELCPYWKMLNPLSTGDSRMKACIALIWFRSCQCSLIKVPVT
jgi:hypothetical protein